MPEWYETQLGPLPVGGWVAAGVGGLGLAWYLKRKGITGGAAPPQGTPAPIGADGAYGGVTGLPAGGNGSPSSTLPSGTGTTPRTFIDNTSWANGVITQLVAMGYDPVLTAQSVGDYLAGNTLTSSETALISTALRLIGPPPFPVALRPGAPIVPTPTGSPSPAPTPTPTPAPTSPSLPGPTLLQTPDGLSVWQGEGGPIYVGISQRTADVFLSYGYQVRYVTPSELAALEARYGVASGYPFPTTGF